MRLNIGMLNRYATQNGDMTLPVSTQTCEVKCGNTTVNATVANGIATITSSQAVTLMPSIGIYQTTWEGVPVDIELVGCRYCTYADVVAYGVKNGDDFGNTSRYSQDDVWAAIAAAEETIEAGTRRSFTQRALDVVLELGLNELPVEDATSITSGTLLNGRQARGIGDAKVIYGAYLDRQINRAAVQLAASYIRPRVGAENVRGASMDGVYVSYTLATGEEGCETGLPEVDAVIASHRSNRSVIL